ncbi:hypothetical protein AB0I22_33620 [Streptomyces sp. NPDC050610]|uniref:hypothetical protein n=1 Tax=Streptomyces sp. NPDC050610 TaxID=3157097 RepID=UPI00343460D0
MIEELNRVVLDDANDLLAPELPNAVQALKSLVDRLPQARAGDVRLRLTERQWGRT